MMISPETRLKMRERPEGRPLMFQSWRNLLFMHWKCDPAIIQKTLPPHLFVDTFDGFAYLAIVPFDITNHRLAFLPPLPGFSHFVEVNVRTYVHDALGTPGVWFYSLDINSPLAALGGRILYSLPYISSNKKEDFSYQSLSPLPQAEPNSLEFFLIERYLLFSPTSQARVYHKPYPLFSTELFTYDQELFHRNHLPHFSHPPDHLIFSAGVDVDIFKPRLLRK